MKPMSAEQHSMHILRPKTSCLKLFAATFSSMSFHTIYSPRKSTTHILYHLREKQQSISGLLSGECGEIFLRYFREYLYRIFEGQLTDGGDIPKEYRLHHAVSSFAETVRWWLKGHSEHTPEQISDFYFRSVNL